MWKNRLLKYPLLAFGLFLGVFIYGNNNPESSGFFPSCPFHSLTGWDCPGCGSQRATHHLINGRVVQAFGYNPLMVLSIPYLLIGFAFEWHIKLKSRFPGFRKLLFGPVAIKCWMVGVVVYAIGRNLL